MVLSTSSSLCAIEMATTVVKRLPIIPFRPALPFPTATRRTFTTSQPLSLITNSRAKPTPSFTRSALQQSFRRSYADVLTPKVKRRGRGFFRWTWRLTYLSALAGAGWLAYNIYTLRTPQEQFEPDQSKKTLVILGMYLPL